MICQHLSINAPRYGASSTCSICGVPIIFDGSSWRWEYEIDREKVRQMRIAYDVDRITGKHADTPSPKPVLDDWAIGPARTTPICEMNYCNIPEHDNIHGSDGSEIVS